MATAWEKKRSKEFINYLSNDLHKAIENRYVDRAKLQTEATRANRLEFYFNRLVDASQFQRAGLDKYFHDRFIDQVIEVSGGGEFLSELFNYDYSDKDSRQLGFQFEEDLQKVIEKASQSEVLNLGASQVYGRSNFLGQDLEQLKQKIGKIPVKALDYYSKALNDWVLYDFNNQPEMKIDSKTIYRLGGVQGKIDLRVPNSGINIQAEASPELNEFISLLQGANISAKNYADQYKVTLGNTNYFRVVSFLLESLGGRHADESNILNVYYKTVKPKKDDKEIINMHKYHMRYVYELIGPGMYYLNYKGRRVNLGTVDYLIIFDKSKFRIVVKGSQNLIAAALQSEVGYKTIRALR